jgi:hypothetical protein
MKTPEGRWRLRVEGRAEIEVLELVRVHLEKERMEDPVERSAFARAVRATGLVEEWRRGRKRDQRTSLGARKLRERAKLIDSAEDVDL